jgi:hypothetical protein
MILIKPYARRSQKKSRASLEVGGFGKLGKGPEVSHSLKEKRVWARQQLHARGSRQTSTQVSSCSPSTQTRKPAANSPQQAPPSY